MTNLPPIPYDFLSPVSAFDLESDSVTDGQPMELPHASGVFGAGGEDLSPALRWSGFPEGTKSFVVTCFDPDAPTGSGFWHWVMYDIPVSVTSLAEGAGAPDSTSVPSGASQLKNDAGLKGFLGAAPPEGHGPHRYVFAVHALSVESLPIDDEARPAICGFNMFGNTLGRALLTGTYER